MKINLGFTDTKEKFVLHLKNSVLNNIADKQDSEANAGMVMTRKLFDLIALKRASLPIEIAKGNVEITGNPLALLSLFGRLDDFDPFFNIVTP